MLNNSVKQVYSCINKLIHKSAKPTCKQIAFLQTKATCQNITAKQAILDMHDRFLHIYNDINIKYNYIMCRSPQSHIKHKKKESQFLKLSHKGKKKATLSSLFSYLKICAVGGVHLLVLICCLSIFDSPTSA